MTKLTPSGELPPEGQSEGEQLPRGEVERDKVLRALERIAFADIGSLVEIKDQKLSIKDIADMTGEERAAITQLKETPRGLEVKFGDRLKSLELLGRHLGLFKHDKDTRAPTAVVVHYDYGDDDAAVDAQEP